jgi:hypothetical protein
VARESGPATIVSTLMEPRAMVVLEPIESLDLVGVRERALGLKLLSLIRRHISCNSLSRA